MTAQITDEELSRIADRIRYRLAGRVRDLRLEKRAGVVILQGRAKTFYAKQLAQHALLDMLDMVRLINEIEVA